MSARRPVAAETIAVVGAGPAGQAQALVLAQAGFAVDLIDAGSGPAPEPVEADLRVFALSPASINLLSSIGAWPVPLASRVCAYRRMQVWQRDPDSGLSFDAAALGWSRLGCIVEHGVLQHALAVAIAAQPAINSHWNTRVEAITNASDSITLVMADGRRTVARLAVAADGAGSPLRALAGIAVHREDYGQSGLVANIRCAEPHDDTARQRFLDSGPLALLPLASGPGDCSIVWSLPAAEAERLRDLPAADFEQALAQAMGGLVGRVQLLGKRALFPLARQLVDSYHRSRVALVADAAHVVHPLAGQGLNLGFLDVAALAQVLSDAHARGLDIGSDAVLSAYARWRQGDNALAAYSFETIDRLFRPSLPGIGALTGLGTAMISAVPALRRHFVLQASGLAGRVPRACQSAAAGP